MPNPRYSWGMAKAGTVTLGETTIARVRDIVAKLGVRRAAAALEVSANSLATALGSLPVRRGTALQIEHSLRAISDPRAA